MSNPAPVSRTWNAPASAPNQIAAPACRAVNFQALPSRFSRRIVASRASARADSPAATERVG